MFLLPHTLRLITKRTFPQITRNIVSFGNRTRNRLKYLNMQTSWAFLHVYPVVLQGSITIDVFILFRAGLFTNDNRSTSVGFSLTGFYTQTMKCVCSINFWFGFLGTVWFPHWVNVSYKSMSCLLPRELRKINRMLLAKWLDTDVKRIRHC